MLKMAFGGISFSSWITGKSLSSPSSCEVRFSSSYSRLALYLLIPNPKVGVLMLIWWVKSSKWPPIMLWGTSKALLIPMFWFVKLTMRSRSFAKLTYLVGSSAESGFKASPILYNYLFFLGGLAPPNVWLPKIGDFSSYGPSILVGVCKFLFTLRMVSVPLWWPSDSDTECDSSWMSSRFFSWIDAFFLRLLLSLNLTICLPDRLSLSDSKLTASPTVLFLNYSDPDLASISSVSANSLSSWEIVCSF